MSHLLNQLIYHGQTWYIVELGWFKLLIDFDDFDLVLRSHGCKDCQILSEIAFQHAVSSLVIVT